MTIKVEKTQEELFETDCKVLNLNYEYNDYDDAEKWAIITDLSEKKLREKYPDIIEKFIPFVLFSVEQGQVIETYDKIEAKHRMRALRHGSYFDINDGEFAEHNTELALIDDGYAHIEQEETISELFTYMDTLEKLQKSRITRFYFEGKSFTAIACEDGVSVQAVFKSIQNGIKKLRKICF